jgi:hypothetical protein
MNAQKPASFCAFKNESGSKLMCSHSKENCPITSCWQALDEKKESREACAITKGKRAKEERDKGRTETLASFNVHSHNEIKSYHEEKRVH